MLRARGVPLLVLLGLALPGRHLGAQSAHISEERRTLPTYPFSEPNPVPILSRDERLYPYHSFEGYSHEAVPREWTVVRLENEWIEVFVLPEVGGKVWGAVVKKTGHEFIYRNEVLKFRNIALRGPWTSGGIEFNFGVIGHTPSTATPVDYVLRENEDGSVSCVVGAMDLPSRTLWRVEIRLPADRAAFETRATWTNPTPFEQPYYNWMTGAAFARDDLVMSIPGNAFLEHSGTVRDWPLNSAGRFLPEYRQNNFASHKSYHVVGERSDFFGGYYRDADYGFGHWARYEEMPGQKLWLWALSREGGIWEDLLTDSDGQYVEYQAGRLFVQYSRDAEVNPISEVGFGPGTTDRWSEVWFPVEGLGGLTDASRSGALFVDRQEGALIIRAHAFGPATDTLIVRTGGRVLSSEALQLRPLEVVERTVRVAGEGPVDVRLPGLGLSWTSEPTPALDRAFVSDPAAETRAPAAQRWVSEGRALSRERRLSEARLAYDSALALEPWNRDALLGRAELEHRRGRFEEGLDLVRGALQQDAYDAEANFRAGALYRAMGRDADAREAFGWAARAMAYRFVSYVQLAELALNAHELEEAAHYARLALDYDASGIAAIELLAVVARRRGDTAAAREALERLAELDPIRQFERAQAYLSAPGPQSATGLSASLRGEYPAQTLLELALTALRRGSPEDARALVRLARQRDPSPLLRAWDAWLGRDPGLLAGSSDPAFVFPYRVESLAVLQWAAEESQDWTWSYLLGLNLWARDRPEEAAALWESLGQTPTFAPFFVARAQLLQQVWGSDPEADLRRAVAVAPADRLVRVELVRSLQAQGRWPDALAESRDGLTRFPEDFNLQLLHARSLLETDQAAAAADLLTAVRVLPSEGARESHALYEQVHVSAALDALDQDATREARDHARAALEWPEHLGQGRPYQPEERLARFVLGLAEQRMGNRAGAADAFEAVLASSNPGGAVLQRLDLLAVAARQALDREIDPELIRNRTDTTAGRLAGALLAGVRQGDALGSRVAALAPDYPSLFTDLVGRSLLRALSRTP